MRRATTPGSANVIAITLMAAILSSPAQGQVNHQDSQSVAEGGVVQPAVDAVLAAFNTHTLVGLSDNHGLAQEMDFYEKLIRDPRFARDIGNVVVEFGGAARQDVIDRYVNGETVPYADLRRVWTDTVGWLPTVIYSGYPHFFAQVRETNRALPLEKRIRVWLGEPPIDWSAIHTRAEYTQLDQQRNSHAAGLIVGNILEKNKKALVIYGGGHFGRASAEETALYEQWKQVDADLTPRRNLQTLVEAEHPGAFFIVRWYAGFEDKVCTKNFERRFGRWPIPAIAAPAKGTSLERDMHRCGRPAGLTFYFSPTTPQPLRDLAEREIDDYLFLADAVLFLGTPESLTRSPILPELYLDEQYRQEISRQMEIKTGQPLSPSWGRNTPVGPQPFYRDACPHGSAAPGLGGVMLDCAP